MSFLIVSVAWFEEFVLWDERKWNEPFAHASLEKQLRMSWIAAFFHGSQYGLTLFWLQVRVLHVVSVVACSLVEWLLLFLPFWLHLLEVNWMMLLYSHRYL
ncbi:hypothetical protein NC652_018181 [Populus alba x Populus x berolinensis]|nr:hypothetical protein NC652_018181 [Populus alba x Populus x berolinensis]